MAAMEVYGSQPMDAVPAGYLAFAASRVSFGGQQPKGSDAQVALDGHAGPREAGRQWSDRESLMEPGLPDLYNGNYGKGKEPCKFEFRG